MERGTKDAVRTYLEAVSARDPDALRESVAEDIVVHGLLGTEGSARGREAYVQTMTGWMEAFPDLSIEIEELIAEGDKAAARWTSTGTQKRPLGGIPATDRKVSVEAVAIIRIKDGKVAEKWFRLDDLGMLRQLGVSG